PLFRGYWGAWRRHEHSSEGVLADRKRSRIPTIRGRETPSRSPCKRTVPLLPPPGRSSAGARLEQAGQVSEGFPTLRRQGPIRQSRPRLQSLPKVSLTGADVTRVRSEGSC